MKKKIILIGIALLFVLLLSTYKLMNARTFQLFGALTNQVDTTEKVVALTFDDGPTKNVDQILALLKQYNVKATFFLIGKDIEQFPNEAEKIAKAGHQIGNHSYSHQRMIFKSLSFIESEVEATKRLIRNAGFEGEIDFRPPYGKKIIGLPYYLNKENIETIMWDVEPESYEASLSLAAKINVVKEEIEPGSIILLHPMYDESGEKLKLIEEIIISLSKAGYRFVTVNELQALR